MCKCLVVEDVRNNKKRNFLNIFLYLFLAGNIFKFSISTIWQMAQRSVILTESIQEQGYPKVPLYSSLQTVTSKSNVESRFRSATQKTGCKALSLMHRYRRKACFFKKQPCRSQPCRPTSIYKANLALTAEQAIIFVRVQPERNVF